MIYHLYAWLWSCPFYIITVKNSLLLPNNLLTSWWLFFPAQMVIRLNLIILDPISKNHHPHKTISQIYTHTHHVNCTWVENPIIYLISCLDPTFPFIFLSLNHLEFFPLQRGRGSWVEWGQEGKGRDNCNHTNNTVQ